MHACTSLFHILSIVFTLCAARSRLLTARGEAQSDRNAQPCHHLDGIGHEDFEGACKFKNGGLGLALLVQVPELPRLWKYRRRQKKKCTALAALEVTEGGDAGLLEDTPGEGASARLPLRVESVEMQERGVC